MRLAGPTKPRHLLIERLTSSLDLVVLQLACEENAAAIRHIQVHVGTAVPHSRDLNRMCTAITNIQRRRKVLPACAFELHFYVFGGRADGFVDMTLDLRDKARLEASRTACTERSKERRERAIQQELEWIRRYSRRVHHVRSLEADCRDYAEGLQMVCARFTGLG